MDRLKRLLWIRIKTHGYITMELYRKFLLNGKDNDKIISNIYYDKYNELYFIWGEYRHPKLIQFKKKPKKCDDCTYNKDGYCSVYKFSLRVVKVDNCKRQETWKEYRLKNTKWLLKHG